MKAILATLLLTVSGAALAETGKPADQPVTVYRDGKPYMDDRLQMRRLLPSGFRSDAQQAPSKVIQDQPITVYKGGKPYIFDGLRRMVPHCQTQNGSEFCSAAPETDKPEAEKKPARKAVG